MIIKTMSDPLYSTPLSVPGHVYISVTNLANLASLPSCTLRIDVFVHLGLNVEGNTSELTLTLVEDVIVQLSQQGGFVLHSGPQTPDVDFGIVEINGPIEATLNALIWTQSNPLVESYPGGFFRFEGHSDHRNEFSKQVVLSKLTTIVASWFGLPNVSTNVNNNAWLLRKTLLAAEDARIPVYIPPGDYTFDETLFPDLDPHPITLQGAKSGQSIITLAEGTYLIEMEGESTTNRLKGVSVRHLNFVGDEYTNNNQPISLQFAEDVDISSCRFGNLLRSIQTKSVYNCRTTDNSSQDIRNHCFYNRQAEIFDGDEYVDYYGSKNIIVRNNKFVRCPKNVSLTSNRAVIFSAYNNPDDIPDNVNIAERHKSCMTAHNHFSDQRCTSVDMIAICRSFLANGNIIEMVVEEFTQNEPMTMGGNWQERTNGVLSADQAGGEEFLLGMNNIINERNSAGSILLNSQGESALFWANQIIGGRTAFYMSFNGENHPEYVRLQRNVFFNMNNTGASLFGVGDVIL